MMLVAAVFVVFMVFVAGGKPSIVVAVELFHFVKFAVFRKRHQFFQIVCAFHPKAGNIRRRIRRKNGGQAFMPCQPVAVGRLNKLCVGMDAFAFGVDQHAFGDFRLKGQYFHCEIR
ncbi:hypothetical protein [Neisseria weaveri]|uniref:hypothetical protein n=1 Tax=Neisseria weaveri TaxID=28091 RepID=UPI003989CF35